MTAALMHGADLIGRPVVDGSTGEDLAEIRDVVFDPGRGVITGFTLRKRGFLGRKIKDVLPIEVVVSVGTDAVMVANVDALTARDDAPDDVVASKNDDVLTNDVITESGRTLGKVRDVIVVGGPSPRVVGFEVAGGPVGNGLVPIAVQTGVSGSALIVPDSYEQRIRTDLTGLAAELTDIERERS